MTDAAAALDEDVPFPAYRFSASWLVGATTFAMDRVIPEVELIYQPSDAYAGGTLGLRLAAAPAAAPAIRPASRKRRAKAMLRPPAPVDLGDAVFFDIRAHNYFNWSHQVNIFLPMALFMRGMIDRPITIVLPEGMPGAAGELYRLFKFEVLATDGTVAGREFRWSFSHAELSDAMRPELLRRFMADHGDDPAFFPVFPDLPRKVFLPRRGNRAIMNQGEIEALLAARGYVTVYAEELTAARQIALLRQATHLVAVHGAALAPLQFRSPAAAPLSFVEICPVGHMTRMFRAMCEQVGGGYCAVRGRLKPEYVTPAYAPGGPFMQFSNDGFEVDPRSLLVALDIEAHGGRIIEDPPRSWPLGG